MSSIGTVTLVDKKRAREPAPPRRAACAAATALFGELIDWRDGERLTPRWRALAGEAAEANPFYAPWALTPALQQYADKDVALACIWDGPERDALLGLAPVQKRRGYARLAVAYWTNWTHPHCYFGAPLIDRGHGRAVAAAFLELLCDGARGRSFFRLRRIYPDGPVAVAFHEAAASHRRVHYVAEAHKRAALFGGLQPDEYLAQSLRKKKRKELSRLRNRLAECGDVAFRALVGREELEAWIQAFLALEDRGWKGQRGTSLQSSPKDVAWFRDSLRGAFDAGELDFLRIDCAGRPIAMLVSFGARARYSVKIAFEPDFARYSPGLMIEIEATKRSLADPHFRFADSCAAPDHPMIERLWRGRRTIASANFSAAAGAGKSALRLCGLLESARAALGKNGA